MFRYFENSVYVYTHTHEKDNFLPDGCAMQNVTNNCIIISGNGTEKGSTAQQLKKTVI